MQKPSLSTSRCVSMPLLSTAHGASECVPCSPRTCFRRAFPRPLVRSAIFIRCALCNSLHDYFVRLILQSCVASVTRRIGKRPSRSGVSSIQCALRFACNVHNDASLRTALHPAELHIFTIPPRSFSRIVSNLPHTSSAHHVFDHNRRQVLLSVDPSAAPRSASRNIVIAPPERDAGESDTESSDFGDDDGPGGAAAGPGSQAHELARLRDNRMRQMRAQAAEAAALR